MEISPDIETNQLWSASSVEYALCRESLHIAAGIARNVFILVSTSSKSTVVRLPPRQAVMPSHIDQRLHSFRHTAVQRTTSLL
jgi:hypothetical protein